MEGKQYIGDSVYVSTDGYSIILTTENDSSGPSNTIALEPAVYKALVQYVERLKKE
jgi:hypothetical protein